MKKTLILCLLLVAVCFPIAQAECLKNEGVKEQMGFGSTEQVIALQKTVKKEQNCQIIALSWETKLPKFLQKNILLFDEKDKQLLRIKFIPEIKSSSYRWESWSDVTKDKILSDKPEDGFDLPNFKASNSSEKPLLSAKVSDFLKKNKLSIFFP